MAKVLLYGEVEGTSSTKNTHFEVSDLRHTITDNYYAENQGALLLYSKGSDHLYGIISRLLQTVTIFKKWDQRNPSFRRQIALPIPTQRSQLACGPRHQWVADEQQDVGLGKYK